ncbi:MAG: STAS domain-containing protein [Methylophilaceae bacterium]
MTTITQIESRWEVAGNILMDSANSLLEKSKDLSLSVDTIIDLSQVAEIDTSAVSLMLEWQRRAMTENKQLKFENLPEGLTSLTALYGIAELIN